MCMFNNVYGRSGMLLSALLLLVACDSTKDATVQSGSSSVAGRAGNTPVAGKSGVTTGAGGAVSTDKSNIIEGSGGLWAQGGSNAAAGGSGNQTDASETTGTGGTGNVTSNGGMGAEDGSTAGTEDTDIFGGIFGEADDTGAAGAAGNTGTGDYAPCESLGLICFDPIDMFILNPQCFTCNNGAGCQTCDMFQAK
jgi:hypothetical protein